MQALSAQRVQLGFNLTGVGPTTRLRTMSGMCTHAVDLVRADDVDDEVAGWLRAAYDQASS